MRICWPLSQISVLTGPDWSLLRSCQNSQVAEETFSQLENVGIRLTKLHTEDWKTVIDSPYDNESICDDLVIDGFNISPVHRDGNI